MSTTDRAMSLSEAGAFLGRSASTTRVYLRAEGLPARLVAGRWVVMESELREWAGRPEIVDMMQRGDNMLNRVNKLAKAV